MNVPVHVHGRVDGRIAILFNTRCRMVSVLSLSGTFTCTCTRVACYSNSSTVWPYSRYRIHVYKNKDTCTDVHCSSTIGPRVFCFDNLQYTHACATIACTAMAATGLSNDYWRVAVLEYTCTDIGIAGMQAYTALPAHHAGTNPMLTLMYMYA